VVIGVEKRNKNVATLVNKYVIKVHANNALKSTIYVFAEEKSKDAKNQLIK
jgi:hypothetical protein